MGNVKQQYNWCYFVPVVKYCLADRNLFEVVYFKEDQLEGRTALILYLVNQQHGVHSQWRANN